MKREEWLAMREKGQYHIVPFYTYYAEYVGDEYMQFGEFEEKFTQAVNRLGGIPSYYSQEVIKYFDDKFNVITLLDKDHKFIKFL